MSARQRLQDVIDRTNAKTGRKVTADELLRLWRDNPAFASLVGGEALRLLNEFDEEERQERADRQEKFTPEMFEEMVRILKERSGIYDAYAEREDLYSHYADAFAYGSNPFINDRPGHYRARPNPFGRSHAQEFTQRPVLDPAKLATARKVKALADDERGDPNTRAVARRKLDGLLKELNISERAL